MFIFSRKPLETLIAPSESLEGSPKRSTFEFLAKAEGDVDLDSDEKLGVSTVMREPGDPA